MSFTESSHIDAKNRIKSPFDTPEKQIFQHVMCFGTFDIFHPGHIYYLREAEKLGDDLIIVIARDGRVKNLKGRLPQDHEDVRRANVASVFKNAQVILGGVEDIFAPLRKYTPDILAFGYDQRVPEEKIRELFPIIEIVRIGGFEPEKWKSSLLRKE